MSRVQTAVGCVLVGWLCPALIFANFVTVASLAADAQAGLFANAPGDDGRFSTMRVLAAVFLAPPIENGLMIWLPWLALRASSARLTVLVIPIAAVCGWWLHGAGLDTIGHGAAFGVLAAWFLFLTRRLGEWPAYVWSVLSHLVWNATVLAISALWG